jgi:hypothetical protein
VGGSYCHSTACSCYSRGTIHVLPKTITFSKGQNIHGKQLDCCPIVCLPSTESSLNVTNYEQYIMYTCRRRQAAAAARSRFEPQIRNTAQSMAVETSQPEALAATGPGVRVITGDELGFLRGGLFTRADFLVLFEHRFIRCANKRVKKILCFTLTLNAQWWRRIRQPCRRRTLFPDGKAVRFSERFTAACSSTLNHMKQSFDSEQQGGGGENARRRAPVSGKQGRPHRHRQAPPPKLIACSLPSFCVHYVTCMPWFGCVPGLLAVGRANGQVHVVDPCNGRALGVVPALACSRGEEASRAVKGLALVWQAEEPAAFCCTRGGAACVAGPPSPSGQDSESAAGDANSAWQKRASWAVPPNVECTVRARGL